MPSTFMPFFIGDYQKNTQRLSTEEHGAYLLMILDYWINGPIPNNRKTLKNITKISQKKLQNVLQFFEEKEGKLTHATIDRIKLKAIENKEKAADKARNAANKRWGNNDACSMLEAMPEQCPSTSYPYPVDKEIPLTPLKNDVKNIFGKDGIIDWDVQKVIQYGTILEAESITKKDINFLAQEFNSWIKKNKIPSNPDKAFLAWCRKLAERKRA